MMTIAASARQCLGVFTVNDLRPGSYLSTSAENATATQARSGVPETRAPQACRPALFLALPAPPTPSSPPCVTREIPAPRRPAAGPALLIPPAAREEQSLELPQPRRIEVPFEQFS